MASDFGSPYMLLSGQIVDPSAQHAFLGTLPVAGMTRGARLPVILLFVATLALQS